MTKLNINNIYYNNFRNNSIIIRNIIDSYRNHIINNAYISVVYITDNNTITNIIDNIYYRNTYRNMNNMSD